MNISKRLTRLAQMVKKGNYLVDVGTDHGYVPIFLMKEKQIPGALAMDINKGPLERAKAHIEEYGLEAYIETRLSDGVTALRKGEAQTVLIAGMGGGLIQKILEEGKTVLEGVEEFILQPQSELRDTRNYLLNHGFKILEEDMLEEDGKYYTIIKATHGKSNLYTEEELLFGKIDTLKSKEVLKELLERNLRIQREILEQLPLDKERNQRRKIAMVEEITQMERVYHQL